MPVTRNAYMPQYFLGASGQGPPVPVNGRPFGTSGSVVDRLLQQRQGEYEQYTNPRLSASPQLGKLPSSTTTTTMPGLNDEQESQQGFGFGDGMRVGTGVKAAKDLYSGGGPVGGHGVNFGQFGELGPGVNTFNPAGTGAAGGAGAGSAGAQTESVVAAQEANAAGAEVETTAEVGGAATGTSAGMGAGAMAGLVGGGMLLSGLMSGLTSGNWDTAWKDGLTFGFYSMFGGE